MKVLEGEKFVHVFCNESFHIEAGYQRGNGVKDDLNLSHVNNEIVGVWWGLMENQLSVEI